MTSNKILVGTSGYNYPEWKGSFYPSDLPVSKMLSFYAGHFPTVEINYTFYRFPNEKTLNGWAESTPDNFRFTLKAPRRITHEARLSNCQELVEGFCSRSQALGSKLGVLLFQLPPSFKLDLDLLDGFLKWIPSGTRAAFEFRNASWLTGEVYARLEEKDLALCIADSEKSTTPVVATAGYGYFRLRDEGYGEEEIRAWSDRIKEHEGVWGDVFVYFKHEEEGKGPEFAKMLMDCLDIAG